MIIHSLATTCEGIAPARPDALLARMAALLALQLVLSSTIGTGFDTALQHVLKRAVALGSVRNAVETELHRLDGTFLTTLSQRLEEAPTAERDAMQDVMNAIGEIFDRPELVRPTAVDEVITRHWSARAGDIEDDAEVLEVDLHALPEGMPRPTESEQRASAYGEVTRAGGRDLFVAMGLSPFWPRSPPAVFVDLGSGAGRLVAQAWLELRAAGMPSWACLAWPNVYSRSSHILFNIPLFK